MALDKIDNLDRTILNIVMKNARIPSKDVAIECGVSRAAIHQRIQRLIEMGVITGSGYNVNPRSLGYNTCTYVGVKLARGSMYREVVKELEKIRELNETELDKKLRDLKEELFNLRFQHAINQLDNPMRLKAVKKEIAVVKTIIRENELKSGAEA